MSALEEPPGDRIEQIAAFIYGEVGPTSICAWESVDEPSKVQWRAIARHLRTLALAAPVGKAGRSAEAAGDEVLRQERAAVREEPQACTCRHPPEGVIGWDRGMVDRECPVHGHEALPERRDPQMEKVVEAMRATGEQEAWNDWYPKSPPSKRNAHRHGFNAGQAAGLIEGEAVAREDTERPDAGLREWTLTGTHDRGYPQPQTHGGRLKPGESVRVREVVRDTPSGSDDEFDTRGLREALGVINAAISVWKLDSPGEQIPVWAATNAVIQQISFVEGKSVKDVVAELGDGFPPFMRDTEQEPER